MSNKPLTDEIIILRKKAEELIEWLNKRTEEYDYGFPIVTDEEWDEKYFELQKIEKESDEIFDNSPTHNISYQVVDKLKKVKHNHPMLSLDKTKDWDSFIEYFTKIDDTKDVVCMLKMDGLTCSLKYENGYLVSAETRGNGEIGEDVLHNILTIYNLPRRINYKEDLIIDGEVICNYAAFRRWKDEYKNPRNFAAGSIRLLNSEECDERWLDFIAWNVVEGFNESNSFIDKLNKLNDLGFETVPYTSSYDWDAKEFLQKKASELYYPIDGLVGRFDDIKFGKSLGSTSHHEKSAYAFKFYDEEYKTKLLDITYDISRTGEMTPVAVFESVDTGDSIVERASLHNLSIMDELSEGFERVGDILTIIKSNEIIPTVIDWEHDNNSEYSKETNILLPEVCPICGEPTEIRESDLGVKKLYCSNEKCACRLENQIEHFFGKKGLDAKGISRKTIGKLIEWGWVGCISDVFELDARYSEWKEKGGFGDKSVTKILDSIEESCNCSFEKFISAMGIPLIGSTASKTLARTFGTYEAFREAVKSNYHFYGIEDFGPEMHSAIINFNYDEFDYIAEVHLNFIKEESEIKEKTLENITVCTTGKIKEFKNRDEFKEKIESLGGKVTGSVTKKTNYLITNDKNSGSAKNKKAQELNIPIISEKEFINEFLLTNN